MNHVSTKPDIKFLKEKKAYLFTNTIKFDNGEVETREVTIPISEEKGDLIEKLKPLVDDIPASFVQEFFSKLLFLMRELGGKDEVLRKFILDNAAVTAPELADKDESIVFKFSGGHLSIKKSILMHGASGYPYQGSFSMVTSRAWVPPLTHEKIKNPKDNSVVFNSFEVGNPYSPISIRISGNKENFPIDRDVSEKLSKLSKEIEAGRRAQMAKEMHSQEVLKKQGALKEVPKDEVKKEENKDEHNKE